MSLDQILWISWNIYRFSLGFCLWKPWFLVSMFPFLSIHWSLGMIRFAMIFPSKIPIKNSHEKIPSKNPIQNSHQKFPWTIPMKKSHQKIPSKIPMKNSHEKFPWKNPIKNSLQPLHCFAPPYRFWLAPALRSFSFADSGTAAMAGGYGGAMAIEGGEDTGPKGAEGGRRGQAEPGRWVTGE